jgi:hypothetical protein
MNTASMSESTAVKSTVGFAAGTGAVLAVNGVSAGIISTVGFGTGGVIAGSTAAGIQAGIGSVAAGSAFAGFQSLGAFGLGVLGTAVVPVAIGTGLVVAAIPLINKWRSTK